MQSRTHKHTHAHTHTACLSCRRWTPWLRNLTLSEWDDVSLALCDSPVFLASYSDVISGCSHTRCVCVCVCVCVLACIIMCGDKNDLRNHLIYIMCLLLLLLLFSPLHPPLKWTDFTVNRSFSVLHVLFWASRGSRRRSCNASALLQSLADQLLFWKWISQCLTTGNSIALVAPSVCDCLTFSDSYPGYSPKKQSQAGSEWKEEGCDARGSSPWIYCTCQFLILTKGKHSVMEEEERFGGRAS